jgi:hypothetical protein
MRKINMKNKRVLALIIVAGIFVAVSGAVQTVNLLAADVKNPRNTELNEHIRPATPAAKIVEGKAVEVLANTPLKKIAEKSIASNTEGNPAPIDKNVSETPISISLYYYNETATNKQTVAVEVANKGTKPIFLHVLGLHGFIQFEEGISKISMYRPIISDPYDVVGATTTTPQVITAGKSFTAYVQDTMVADGFDATACYTYQQPPSWDLPADQEDKVPHIPSYCASLPPIWIS